MATATRKNGKLKTVEVGKVRTPQIGAFAAPNDEPWSAEFAIRGTASLLFHRYLADEGDGPEPRKGSSKEDVVENYVYRCDDGTIGLPGEMVRQAMIGAAKYRKDPRSSRASAVNLFKAGVIFDTEIASLGSEEWDYLDRRRAVVQRAGIKRVRPAFEAGWEATFRATVLLPEYVSPALFLDVLVDAGRFSGVGDFRPSFGRFAVVRFEVVDES